ncbi:MAG TPA: efflux RND transporter periplasmic adaptor subunit [Gemmatimonadales bacterium]|nr:efflux RND transporter periplasmic adaptor subunit [Gemmatimonadales bacterium]
MRIEGVPFRTTTLAIAGVAVLNACTSHRGGAAPRVPVSVARVEKRSLPYELESNGTVEPIRSVQVLPQVNGTILRVHFAEGDEVSAGQTLFEIDPRPYQAALQQAEGTLARDMAQASTAAREAARYKVLATTNTVTQEDYEAKQSAADAAAAAVRSDSAAAAIAQLNLEYATVRAPIAGRTGKLLLHEGNVVRSGSDPLVSIVQMRPILVRFSVPAVNLPAVRQRSDQQFTAIAIPARDSASSVEGVLSFVDNQVDSATGTVLLKARFPNRDGALWPGEFVRITLVLGTQTDAVVVPSQAVMQGQQGTYVFVVNSDGTAITQPVTVERTLDSLTVLAGVPPGALVVTDGQLRLTPNAKVDIRGGPTTETSGGGGGGGSGSEAVR